jgi:GIY-YIG catalytic domain
MAELAVISIQKKPEAMAFLRSLDVLFMDEMGQLSVDIISVLDIVMRRIRNSSLFMGGVLIIGTLDKVQLRPIKELPFLLSPYILTTFCIGKLTQYVRCAECPILQEMNELARFYTSDEELLKQKLDRFVTLVSTHCTFVDTWDDEAITESVLRVFPKRQQAFKATEKFLANKQKQVRSKHQQYLKSIASDMMIAVESHGDWTPATRAIVGEINCHSFEPDEVHFFCGAVYQFTYSFPGKFNATQLGVMMTVPTSDDAKKKVPLRILAAPSGVKVVALGGKWKQDLLDMGWREVMIGCAPEYTTTLWSQGVKVKRRQYGLKHHVASTVHSAIGHMMPGIATELSSESGVWERAMVVVLISHVRRAGDLIFVGSKDANLQALLHGLRIRCQYDDYMNHIVDAMTGTGAVQEPMIRLNYHPCRPRDITLPTDRSGVVYLLVSMKNSKTIYVGMTQNLPARLNQHNSGFGSTSTCSSSLRPWALFAYACGFCGN